MILTSLVLTASHLIGLSIVSPSRKNITESDVFFTSSTDKNESLALLFKIFTKIWLLSRQASADDPDMHVEDRLAGMLLELL